MRAIINKKMRKNPNYIEFMKEKDPNIKFDFIKKDSEMIFAWTIINITEIHFQYWNLNESSS